MKIKGLMLTCLLASTINIAHATDINVYSWDELRDYAKNGNLNDKYILNDSVSPNGNQVEVGNWGSSNTGSWNLNGNNVLLNGNYNNNRFNIQNNITSFIFENLNIEQFKNGGQQGGVFWTADTLTDGQLLNSTIVRSGAREGGVIYNNGTFSNIIGNTFTNNFTDNGNGGVIYNNGTIKNISNNIFSNNSANQSSSAGGVIHNSGTIETIAYNTINENYSSGNAGAIYNAGTIGLIDGGSISYNTSDSGGGAIYNESGSSINTISGVDFENNVARNGNNGGAINNNGTINTIENSEFEDNGGLVNGQGITSLGGAIYNSKDIGKITGSTFALNRAKYGGGAIYNKGGKIEQIASTFNNNYSESYGGGSIKNSDNGTITLIADAKFTNNTAAGTDGQGGAIWNNAAIGTISGTEYKANTATEDGGAIYNSGSINSIASSTFENNGFRNNQKNGGAINNQNVIKNISDSIFANNGVGGDNRQNASVGGAIFNTGTIGEINEDGTLSGITGETSFTGNNAEYGGGAVFNRGTIHKISAKFEQNTANSQGGGAIKNTEGGKITLIDESVFVGNIASGDEGKGGAIRNVSDIATISNSQFYSNSSNDFGGALSNSGKIETIDGATFGKADSANQGASGGAINNQDGGQIGTITGTTFAYNKAQETTDFDQGNGGAIRNFGGSTITNINGGTVFEGNLANGLKQEYVSGKNVSHVYGGAIYNMNNSTIDTIENVTFKNNIVQAVKDNQNVTGYAHGGAISNGGEAIIDNNTIVDNSSVINTIKNVTFEGNKAIGSAAYGGAIFNSKNSGGIGEIIGGAFTNNSVEADIIAMGGAIYTEKDMLLIADGSDENTKTLSFSGNTTKDNHNGETHNAIFVNKQTADTLTVTLKSQNGGEVRFDDEIDGGKDDGTGFIARENNSYNLKLDGDELSKIVLNNSIINANATLTNANLVIGGLKDNVSNVFANEYTTLNAESGNISLIDDTLANYNINKLVSGDTKWAIDLDWAKTKADTITISDADSSGLVKLAALNIMNNTTDYKEEAKIQVIKGAVANGDDANLKLSIDDLDIRKADLYQTTVKSSTIVADTEDAITLGKTDTADDSLVIKGKLYDTLWYICTLETKTPTETKKFIFDNSKPVYSYESEDPLKVVGDLAIQGDSSTSHLIDFKDTTDFSVSENAKLTINNAGIVNAKSITNDGTLITDNALLANVKTLTNNNSAEFNNTIFATEDDNIVNNNTMKFTNSVINSKVKNEETVEFSNSGINNTLENTNTANFKGNNNINGGVSGANGVMNMVDGVQNINSTIDSQTIVNNGAVTNINDLDFINNNNNVLTVNNGVVNIPSLGLNTLTLNALNMNGGNVNIASVDVDLLNEVMGRVSAPDSEQSTGGTITINDFNLISDTAKSYLELNFADGAFADRVVNNVHHVDTKIARYDVNYNTTNGNFAFSRPKGYRGYNPTVFASAVATQVGGYISELSTVEHSFYHIDTWGMLPQNARFAQNNANKYAINDSIKGYVNNSNEGIWVRPYTSFETVSLSHGPNVSTINYGTLIGGDTDFIDMGKGWKGVISAFVGYNGSNQDYARVTTYQNGGVLGATASFYKGKFFTGLTANVGASVGESNTMYGNDTFAMLMSGIASKTGYNWELNKGKFIIQPSMLLGYSFVNTFDYTSAGGVKMDSDPLHAIQIAPRLRFISNLENGWQPYAQVGMVWNIIDKTRFTANDVRLPQLGIGPYVEYGLGLQRRWSDDSRYSAFGQAVVRNGARNGVALSFGFKAMLGKKAEKVKLQSEPKTVLKSKKNNKLTTNNI